MDFNYFLRKKALRTYSETLPPKKSKFSELKRQSFHILYGVSIILSTLYYDTLTIANVLLFFLFVGGILSFFQHKRKVPIVNLFLEHLDRENELFPGKGAFFFTFGCLMTLYIFPQNIALAGISVLTFGDSFSHLFGVFLKKRKNIVSVKKMVEGSLFGVIVSSVVASFFVDPVFGLLGSLAAMSTEFFENVLAGLDDNFYIPIIASGVIFLLSSFLA